MNNSFDLQQIQEKAINLFNSGFNCSQSVLAAYSDNLNLDSQTALGVACGFGAGMGRLQGTCGAVTGAYMVFGMYCSKQFKDHGEQKEKSYLMIQDFHKRFVEKYKTTDCKLLLNCDLSTADGQEQFQSDNLKVTICESCIKDAIQIVNEQIKKQ